MNLNIRQKKVIEAKENKIICLATAASGKAIPIDTLIPTPNGNKLAKEIKIGDMLFDRNGEPTKVLGVYPQGKKNVYEITFGDGRKAKCCDEHIWSVNKVTWKDRNSFRPMTLKEILKNKLINSSRGANFYIPVAGAVKYTEKEYKIHPYVIGAFIGDGCCKEKYLTLSSENDVIPNRIKELINADDIYKNPANYNWVFKKDGHNIKTADILSEEIIQLSFNKRIPEIYKYGSVEQRLSLIQGLMDTDGSITKDNRKNHESTAVTSFTSTSYNLILDVKEVLGSLGIISTITEDRRNKYTNGICYNLIINTTNENKVELFWLPRKKEIALSVKDKKQSKRYDRTSIREIKNLNYETEMVCFEVDNEEHLYLMNDFIVTHNTACLTERIRRIIDEGCSPENIAAITFTTMAADEMKERLGEQGQRTFIGTIHSLANNICIENGIDTTEIIANEQFDTLLKKVLTIPKKKIQVFEHVLVDEFQDISELEYNFIEHIPKKNIYLTGDERQMIYGFKGCSDKFLRDLYEDASYKVYYLIDNYRNPPNVIKFAEDLIGSLDKISPPSNPTKQFNGHIEKCSFYEALEEMEWSQDWANWYVICRTNNEVASVMEILDRKKIPYVSFKRGDVELVEMNSMLRDNRVKVLTVHAMKGLQGKNIIVMGAKMYNDEERRIAYVAATRAESSLYWCPSIVKRRKGGPSMSETKRNKDVMKRFSKNMVNFGG